VDVGPNNFPFTGWEWEFGRYNWFYVSGALDAMRFVDILAVSDIVAFAARAIKECPEEWKNEFRMGEWNSLAHTQIFRMARRQPLRYDKALLSILALELAGEAISDFDVYTLVDIRPAIFVIDRFDSILRAMQNQTIEMMMNELGLSRVFIDEMARENAPMTYRTGEMIEHFLRARLRMERVSLRMLHSRADSGRRHGKAKRPNPWELVS